MSTIFLVYSTIIIEINGILCQKAKKGGDTLIDYSPLWETMKQRHISQYALINKGIDKHTLDQLRKIRTSQSLPLKNCAIFLIVHPMMYSLLKMKKICNTVIV